MRLDEVNSRSTKRGPRPASLTVIQDRLRLAEENRARFVEACEQALELSRKPESGWLAEADLMLSATSWNTTQARMAGLIADLLGTRVASAASALLVAAE